MNRILSFIIVLIPLVLNSQDIDFDKFFEDKTLNLEVYHSGRYALEYYSIDNSYLSGSWAGTRTKLIDKTNYGVHKVEVFEPQTNKLIYSRNYCSLFEEWSTTSQGRNSCGNFEEVLR
ncbi:MAG: peptidase M64 N-terminal domain-containing protein, partial [Bacteroidales bacterium]|nr:peptidase M64 N-terminal domain-containing protein [Bacteroidales bacterium]